MAIEKHTALQTSSAHVDPVSTGVEIEGPATKGCAHAYITRG